MAEAKKYQYADAINEVRLLYKSFDPKAEMFKDVNAEGRKKQ